MRFVKHVVGFTAEKIAQRLALIEPLVYKKRLPLEAFRYKKLGCAAVLDLASFDSFISDAQKIEPCSYWGVEKTDFVMQNWFTVSEDLRSGGPVALHLPIGNAQDFYHPEALVYIDRIAYAAVDSNHQEIILPPQYCDGKKHEIILHGWTRCIGLKNIKYYNPLYMQQCSVAAIDQKTRDFIATARTALGSALALPEDAPAKGRLLNALDAAFKKLDIREPCGDLFYNSVDDAHAVLFDGIKKGGTPLDVNIVAVGHSHIDVAWLWQLAQTRLKCGRSFHTVMRLMEQFKDYRFSQSQPQLYDYVRQDYPELFEAIKTRVKEGRWEVLGGMWIEADCNVSGAESLARQFLLGRNFFAKHFGEDAESPILWLPDAFGFCYCLPQLIKLADMKYFFTTKISWNTYNMPPYDSFWWKGLDGTKILTSFCSTPAAEGKRYTTYNGKCTPEELYQTWTNFPQKESQQTLITSFGHGDGGGGPTRQMLETIRELSSFPDMPKVAHGKAIDFFRQMEKEIDTELPVWDGELYLEYHRGTFTTQAKTKQANRRSEFKMHDAEFLASTATLLDRNYAYPKDRLNKAWELICLNQFHDILPGSSIGEVYDEAIRHHQQIQTLAAEVQNDALAVIDAGTHAQILIVNPASFVRTDLAFWAGKLAPGQALKWADGAAVMTQEIENGTLIAAGALEPFSITPLSLAKQNMQPVANFLSISEHHIENDMVRIEINADGDIARIYDKVNQRDVLSKNAVGNQFQAFEDRPINFDAWDVDIFFEDKMWTSEPARSITVVETGPLRATLEVKRKILSSEYTQRISLRYNSPQVDFDTTINWQERCILLKAAFPVDILARQATYEIQWGNIQRPTHQNTSWDWARFEVCAQKWVNLSEGDYDVSLINDCKYGHDIKENVMRISLLRSTTYPDANADRGTHRFAYSLLPHRGGLDSQTIAAAYAFNDPLIVYQTKQPENTASSRQDDITKPLIKSDSENIVIETIKQAEDGRGIIIRFYEALCRRGRVKLTTNFEIAQCSKTNLLEKTLESVTFAKNTITLDVRPYEIVNLRLVSAKT